MNPQDETIYRWELQEQITFVQIAAAGIDRELREGSSDGLWFHIDAALAAMTRIANLLWPSTSRESAQLRAEHLRKVLGAPDEATPGLRGTRNGLEHFDERIDTWRAKSVRHAFVDRNVGQPVTGVDPGDVARHYRPATGDVSVFGVEVNLPQALADVQAIEALLQAT